MNPASNFACYRTMFKVATESKGGRVSVIFPLLPPASIQNSPRQGFANSVRLLFYFQFEFTIPFFSLFVKDVYFLNEGHSNRLSFFFLCLVVCLEVFHVRGFFLCVSYLSMFFVIFLKTSQWTHKLRGRLVLSTVLFISSSFLSCIGSIFFVVYSHVTALLLTFLVEILAALKAYYRFCHLERSSCKC